MVVYHTVFFVFLWALFSHALSNYDSTVETSSCWQVIYSAYPACYALAASSNGSYVYASQGVYGVYMSQDYGVTWTLSFKNDSMYSLTLLAASSSGQYSYTAGTGGSIYSNANYGNPSSWVTSNILSTTWSNIATDYSGAYVYAADSTSSLYASSNYGSSWAVIYDATPCLITVVGISGNAANIFFFCDISSTNYIYRSQDQGSTWASVYQPIDEVTAFAISELGQYVYAITAGGVYVSNNYGSSGSWSLTYSTTLIAGATTSSGQVVYVGYSYLYENTMYGASGDWNEVASPSTGKFVAAVATSSDGSYSYMGTNNGTIFRCVSATSFSPSVTPTYVPTLPTTVAPTNSPIEIPTISPSLLPSTSDIPTFAPSMTPSDLPFSIPSAIPSSASPTFLPSMSPSALPTLLPVINSAIPSPTPSIVPSVFSQSPSQSPSQIPSAAPSSTSLSASPSFIPSLISSTAPIDGVISSAPSIMPISVSSAPTPLNPTATVAPSAAPVVTRTPTVSAAPSTAAPTLTTYAWSPRLTMTANFSAVAVSLSGDVMLASDFSGINLYASLDGGTTWSLNFYGYSFSGMAMNATGGTLYAAPFSGPIYKSTNTGIKWLPLSSSNSSNWTSIATDSQAQLVFASSTTNLAFSSDGGDSWTDVSTLTDWTSVAGDYAGSLFFAVRTGANGIYTFIYANNQQQLNFVSSTISGNWNYIACSGIGNLLAVIVSSSPASSSTFSLGQSSQRHKVESVPATLSDGTVYLSINSGGSWLQTSLEISTWTALAIDGQGTTIAAASYDLGIYISNSYGRSWYLAEPILEVSWGALSMSATGNAIAFGTNNGQIWVGISQEPTSPPTKPPTSKKDSHSAPSFLSFPSANSLVIICSVIPPALLILAAVLVRLLRNDRFTQEASALRAWPVEAAEVCIQSFTWLLFMQALFGVSDDKDSWILIVARLPVIMAWITLCCLLVIPNHVSAAKVIYPRLLLSDYLHTPSMLDTFLAVRNNTWYALIMFLSVLDLKLLCYLPWKRTSFTDLSYGFPNLYTARCCLYSSCLASVIQTIGSIVLLATNEESKDVPAEAMFVTFNVLSVVRSSIQIAMFFTLFDLIRREEEITAQSLLSRSTGGDLELHPSVADVKPRFELHADEGEDDGSKLEEMEEGLDAVALHETHAVVNPIAHTSRAIVEEDKDDADNQLKNLGARPLEYITLQEIQSELNFIISLLNAGESYDEGRFDYLLMCMELNPDYQAQKAEEARRWRDEVLPFAEDCLDEMRGFIPPNIFTMTEALLTECGVNAALAKRIMTKKCLWLIRIDPSEIERLHEAELTGRFNPEAQNLDLVELAAIYASLPLEFQKDPLEKKKRWRMSVEGKLKSMLVEKKTGKLTKSKERSDCYLNQPAVFAERDSLHVMDGIGLKDAVDRKSFLDIKRRQFSLGMIASNVDEATGRRVSRLVSVESVYAPAEEMASRVVFDTIVEEEDAANNITSPLHMGYDLNLEDKAPASLQKPPPGILQDILAGRSRLKKTKK
eukprot:gene22954-27934_t